MRYNDSTEARIHADYQAIHWVFPRGFPGGEGQSSCEAHRYYD